MSDRIHVREEWGVKIACSDCRGSGVHVGRTADSPDATVFDTECDSCKGKGWHWAPKWDTVCDLQPEDWRHFPTLTPWMT